MQELQSLGMFMQLHILWTALCIVHAGVLEDFTMMCTEHHWPCIQGGKTNTTPEWLLKSNSDMRHSFLCIAACLALHHVTLSFHCDLKTELCYEFSLCV